MTNNYEKEKFLYPKSSYRGKFTPENMLFNTNLQEFAQRVSYICNLETAGKLKPGEAYGHIKQLWKQLKQSRKELGIIEDTQDDGTAETQP